MTTETIETRITAFLDGEDSLAISNIIHSTDGAQEYGYDGALVGGVTVFSWSVAALIEAVGDGWLADGWVDFSLRRPVYPGYEMTTRVTTVDGGDDVEFVMLNQEGERCVAGAAGRGRAVWFDELQPASRIEAEQEPADKPQLTPAIVPTGEDLRPMPVPFSEEDAAVYADTRASDSHSRWRGEGALLHPGWIAARATPLMRHSYTYGPSIHARSQIQHLAPARAGQTVVVAGHVTDAYERKGHEYVLVDCSLLNAEGGEFARLRHTTIYQVAKRG